MNHSRLEQFAVEARKELIDKVILESNKLGVYENRILEPKASSVDVSIVNGMQLDAKTMRKRETLVSKVKTSSFEQVMEEVAYTWFNRFVALRFMEVHDYLPVRVLSSSSKRIEPDIMFNAPNINWDIDIDVDYILDLKANNEQDELFKYLILKVCNELNKYLPFMFGSIEDYMEILFPSGLLNTDSFLMTMVNTDIFPESEWEDVEIIGWLYQYYISEEKDRVFSSEEKYKAEEIPFATELYTPDWIVRYLVQNSLGKYWLEHHPEDKLLSENWDYYLETDQTENLNSDEYLDVRDITILDPAMGSGHILVYAFEVLCEIYEAQGYPRGEIAKLIINNNIFGLELDDRAYQLACFSLSMQARRYDSKFFEKLRNKEVEIHLASIQETNSFTNEMITTLAGEPVGEDYDFIRDFIDQYHNAKTYGSLIKTKIKDASFIEDRLSLINEELDNFNADTIKKLNEIVPTLVKQNNILSSTYDILVMNPPYMGSRDMNKDLKDFLNKYYPDSKADLFACFMELDHLQKDKSLYAAITMHSWMFLSSYEDLRNKVLLRKTIDSMAHLGTKAFEQIGGEVVQTTAFVLRNHRLKDADGKYIRLVDYKDSETKRQKLHEASNNETKDTYVINQNSFRHIPGNSIAYWAPKPLVKIFDKEDSISKLMDAKQGLATTDKDYFLRLWWELNIYDINFNATNLEDAKKSQYKWFPFNKGGKRRQWYGNYDYVVNWFNDGQEIKETVLRKYPYLNSPDYVVKNTSYYFKKSITWGKITSSGFSIRFRESGSIHGGSGMSAFTPNDKLLTYVLGLTITKVANYIFKMINPTLNLQAGDFEKLPIVTDKEKYPIIEKLVLDSIDLAKKDWDSFETSWDFKVNPLLTQNTNDLAEAYELYKEKTNARFKKLKANEEKLNKIVIPMYGLENQLSSDLENKDITFASIHDNEIPESFKENDYALTKEDVVKNFISYAIGCIFGRYSLDEEGLVYTGGDFNLERYKTYKPVEDNILFLSPDFDKEGDLLDKFIEFVEVALGSENLDDNLNFIAEALGKKRNQGDKEAIKHYLLNKFYKDHAKKYSVRGSGKRPIYWQFASTNRQNSAFNALIYMHRYDKYTLSRIRTDYLHKTQERLDNMYREYTNIAQISDSKTDVKRAKKKLRDLDKSRPELKEYDEKLHHLADQQIELDLNDGFKQNYPKFEGVVKKL